MSTPVAFLSYAHLDDHDGGVTDLRAQLENAISQYLGRRFPIFQDRRDLRWGDNWRERVERSIDASAFLIAVLSPAFFASRECRAEVTRFLDRERELGRTDLVLPIYYVDAPAVNARSGRLARVLIGRQHADWRELRFEPPANQRVRRALAELATQLRESLATRPKPGPRPRVARPAPVAGRVRPPAKIAATTEAAALTVAADGSGDYATIAGAIAAAAGGEYIRIKPGLYEEPLIIDKPIFLAGEGGPGAVVLRAKGRDAIVFRATMGRVSNLTIEQRGSGKLYAVDIAQGRLELVECTIRSEGAAAVIVHGAADPLIRSNDISNTTDAGVFVYDDGAGTLENNHIHDVRQNAIVVGGRGNPTVRRNTIRGPGSTGIWVFESGRGVFEENDVTDLAFGAVIQGGAQPTFRANRISRCTEGGLFVNERAAGVYEGNDISENGLSGISVAEGAAPHVRGNKLHGNGESGVIVWKEGAGVYEDNRVYDNGHAGFEIAARSEPVVRNNTVTGNGYEGVWVYDGGRGTFEGNDLRGNRRGAWDVPRTDRIVRRDNRE